MRWKSLEEEERQGQTWFSKASSAALLGLSEGESGQKAGVREADRATQAGDSGAWDLSAIPIPSQLICRHLHGFLSSACSFCPSPLPTTLLIFLLLLLLLPNYQNLNLATKFQASIERLILYSMN